jgi:cytochrome c peroxidase
MKAPAGQVNRSVRTWRRVCPFVFALAGLASAASAQAPQAAFTTNPFPAKGVDLITVQFVDLSTGQISAWNWDLGDGTTSSERNPLHTYGGAPAFGFGNFDVTLTVSGPGGSSSFTLDSAVELMGDPPSALATMPVPMPDQLFDFVADMDHAVELGKALFWDVQLGSDGLTACASCHYHAGVDNRPRNTLHPGANGTFEPTLSGHGGGPNTTLIAGDFPFTKFLDPMDGLRPLGSTDDRRGATGVFQTSFAGIDPERAVDLGQDQDDALFQVGGADTLRVTGRDAPTTIGAVFFHRIFWDGRANHFFNGRNIWGNADPNHPPVLEKRADGSLGEIAVLLNNAAAASQAVGPPLSDVEMSWGGRTWPEVGRKMIPRQPLARQFVDATDGVLGDLAQVPGPGLLVGLTYADMIRAAFRERWWGSGQITADGFTQMEANFALLFGLAIQCYEATLIPDQAPYDRFRSGDFAALTAQQQRGLSIFLGKGRCITCHDTPLFAGSLRDEVIHNSPEESEGLVERMIIQNSLTSASLTFATQPGPGELPLNFNPYKRPATLFTPSNQVLAQTTLPSGLRCPPQGEEVFPLTPSALVAANAGFLGSVRIVSDGQCNLRVIASFEWGAAGPPGGTYQLLIGGLRFNLIVQPPSRQAVYDNGFYNIGVRPSTDDPGVGGEGAFGPLSITRRVQRGEDVGQNTHGAPILPNERVAVTGSFKTPTLRNVELTGPYMHNGGFATLEQVVEFYTRGTDFGDVNFRDKDIDVSGITDMTEADKADLVAFLKSLTDPRVRFERAPFDHPEIPLKAGHVGDNEVASSDALGNAQLVIEHRPATGAAGGTAIPAFIDRLRPSITVFLARETSSSALVALICDKEPQADVRIRVKSSEPSSASLSVAEVLFTPADWRVTRFVEVQRLAPGSGAAPFLFRTTNARSSDPQFSNLDVDDLRIDFVPNTSESASSSSPIVPRLTESGSPTALR